MVISSSAAASCGELVGLGVGLGTALGLFGGVGAAGTVTSERSELEVGDAFEVGAVVGEDRVDLPLLPVRRSLHPELVLLGVATGGAAFVHGGEPRCGETR